MANITAHGGCTHPHFHQVKVYGTKNTFINSLPWSGRISSSDPGTEPIKDIYEYPDKKSRSMILNSFIDHLITKHKPPLVSREETIKIMSVCIAAEKAVNEIKISSFNPI